LIKKKNFLKVIYFICFCIGNTRKIQDMRNIREEKMQKLRTRNAAQVHSAISWIEQNKSRFKGKVYEPMFFLVIQI
jgi:hypothetical protein